MAGLGLLIYGALRAAVGIGQTIDNHHMKKESFSYTNKVEPTWLDRNCNRYINGERVIATYDYKNKKLVYAGKNSGKVYYDPEQKQRNTDELESDGMYIENRTFLKDKMSLSKKNAIRQFSYMIMESHLP